MPRPHILFLIADDHRHDVLGVAGSPARTPHLDALAARGTRLGRHHCQGGMTGAICAPSRASILSGREVLAATAGLGIGTPQAHDLAPDAPTLPQVLRGDGYRTYGVGKWHNGTESFHRSFDDGAQIFFGGMSEHTAVPVHDYDPTGVYPESSRRIAEGFSTEVFAQAVIELLEAHQRRGTERSGTEETEEIEPFFLWAAFTAPHDPRTPPEEFAALYDSTDPAAVPLPENFRTAAVDTTNLGERDENLAAVPRDPEEVRRHLADYYGMISHLDHGIGQILEHLTASGMIENTLVVYTADHGLALGQHGMMGKQSLYEHSLRVPLILAGPGIEAGRVLDPLTLHADLLPTLLGCAGAPIPAGVQGHDLGALLTDEGATAPREVVHAAYVDRARMASDGAHKLIRHLRPIRRDELYALRTDPGEVHDVAADPQQAQSLARLAASLATWQQDSGDPWAERP
ncbi:sulfatase [Brachybacterium vulturis]|uniref:Sulfatase n=1 Tax=Brachybacterium vulturis TaxID=2017484 RepID=A0A291GR77_9MICO|nr:sulfatase-like hydrolase/transferase [Brachybacterium vulturis]ATG52983.1 sulfatase [Brachybacterium vulturis]